jgi:hypothetical protein
MSKMSDNEKETHVSRILSGVIYCKILGKEYLIQQPSLLNRHLAQLYYNKKYEHAKQSGIMTEEQLVDFLLEENLWSHEEEYRLDELPERIEDAKVSLYQSYANYKSRENMRVRLKTIKKEYTNLLKKKSLYRQDSAEAFAETAKMKFDMFAGMTDMNGKNLFRGEDYVSQSDFFCNSLLSKYLSIHLFEEDVRTISRTEPWRGFWNTGKSESGVFSKPSTELTTEQRSVIAWSRIYDSIFESPDAPPEEVVEDNDMLDGWLILQHRKRKSHAKSQTADSTAGVKGDEVYLFADGKDDAKRIYELNDRSGRGQIRQKQKEIDQAAERGKSLPAEATTEAKLEMRRMSNEKFKSAVKPA